MSVILKGAGGTAYVFEGPFENLDHLAEEPGVYAVLCVHVEEIDLIDVGESPNVRTCISNSDRSNCWRQHCLGLLKYAVYYENENKIRRHARAHIVKDIAANYYLICGG